MIFESWQELHQASAETINTVGKRLADAIIVAVHDHMHLEVVLAFAEQGYHILCEKPMSTNLEDCIKMEAVVKKAGIIFGMGHGKRYKLIILLLLLIYRFACSSAVFTIQLCYDRDHPLWGAWGSDQCRTRRARRILSFRALIRAWPLGEGRGQLLLTHDQELPVSSLRRTASLLLTVSQRH